MGQAFRFAHHTCTTVAMLSLLAPPTLAAEESTKVDMPTELANETAPLPKALKIHVKRRDLGPGPGRIVDITDLRIKDGKVTARMTMDQVGAATGCRLWGHSASGEYDGKLLTLKPVIAPGDDRTCTMEIRLTKGEAGWTGTAGTTMDAKEIR
jgi:hypothetical protein